MSVACDRSLMLVVEEGRSGRGESARSNSNIFYRVRGIKRGRRGGYVPFALTGSVWCDGESAKGKGATRAGAGEEGSPQNRRVWGMGRRFVGRPGLLACRRQSPLLCTQQVRGFFIVEGKGRLAGFIFRPTWEFSTCESRDDIHGLGVLRSSRPALGIKWSRHLRDVERMELSSLTERALHNRRRQDMVGRFLGRELVASRFSIAVPLLPMGRCQDRVPSAMSGPSMTYLHISNSTMLFTDAEPQPTMMLHAGYGLGIRQSGRYPLTCG